MAEEQLPAVLRAFLAAADGCPEDAFTDEAVKAIVKGVQQQTGFKGKQLFMPIRAAVTGQTHGPDLNRTIALLGKRKVAERVEARL